MEADLQELGSLVEKAERTRVQELLKQEQKKVEKELSVKRQQKADQARREADPSTVSKPVYTVKITNYGMVPCTTLNVHSTTGDTLTPCSHFGVLFIAWDQSEKFVKIYLTLKDVHKIPMENVEISFTEG